MLAADERGARHPDAGPASDRPLLGSPCALIRRADGVRAVEPCISSQTSLKIPSMQAPPPAQLPFWQFGKRTEFHFHLRSSLVRFGEFSGTRRVATTWRGSDRSRSRDWPTCALRLPSCG